MDKLTLEKNTSEYSGLSLKKTAITIGSLALACIVIITLLNAFKPEAKKKPKSQNIVAVETVNVISGEYPVILSANGTITAKNASALIAQVSGEITHISEQFNDGANFKKGDVLLKLNRQQYTAAANNAQANFSQAQVNYQTQSALAVQAAKDWGRLGYEGEPNDQVLRKPQLTAAKDQLNSAKSALSSARLSLSKTTVRAPYDGNVSKRNVGLGQFVNTGTPLGNIFSTQGLEVTLPLNQEQYSQLDQSSDVSVILSTELAGKTHEWSARLSRTAQSFDIATRQIDAIVNVSNPISTHGLELKIGQYVNAKIHARTINNALIVPNSSVREGSYIYLFNKNQLQRQAISIVWQDDDNTIIESIPDNAQVVTTSLSGVVSGTKAKLLSDKSGKPKKGLTKIKAS